MSGSWRPVIRPAALVLGAAVLVGVLQGWLWSAIAPGVQWQAVGDGRAFGLATSSANAWVAIALYVLLGIVVGIVLGVAAWRVRTARGLVMFAAVTLSALAGAAVAYLVGNALATGVDPTTVTELSVVTAPPAHYWLAMIVQPALAAATYTFLAAWNGSPTMGRTDLVVTEPTVEPITQPLPVLPTPGPDPV